ncbi:hypothetical protein JOC94_000471 [Bacillus thermophilus]|uniref:Uncharacterized protein n=1 Tax=Siminovitchia thermophila TaxID=1245522 RepID=A0ABS2R3N6_9BACI|nr:hypothetical protein [Siminovitchia thermophila]
MKDNQQMKKCGFLSDDPNVKVIPIMISLNVGAFL